MPPPIIGICGHQHHGKDTVADAFGRHDYIKLRIIDPVKHMLRAHLRLVLPQGVDMEAYIEGPLKDKPSIYLSGRTPREFLQKGGTEFVRDMLADTFLLDTLFLRARKYPRIVVPDVRYVKEAEAIRSRGGIMIRVWATTPEGHTIAQVDGPHRSEAEIHRIPIDHTIFNNRTNMNAIMDCVNRVMEL